MRMPSEIGPFHIIGIGGIGMSAIADILVARGYCVQGSDMKDSANVRRLRARGVRIFIGHDPVNLVGARYVVISSAVKSGNPELEGARAKGLPIIRRAEMLAELMRPCSGVSITGTHGKTTTTSLASHLMDKAGLDPTVITGGIISDWGTNARFGSGPWMIVEADESDGTFNELPSQIGVVTNADPEHLDYYGSVETMHRAYKRFMTGIPFYGMLVACTDHPVVAQLLEQTRALRSARLVTYGVGATADMRVANARADGTTVVFDLICGANAPGGARTMAGLRMPVPGDHSALNATAAIAVASAAGARDDQIRAALATFSGVKRRFTWVGDWNGISIYDDYAHHPVEIAAVLKAARAATRGRVIAVMQPHRYTRLHDLMHEFAGCLRDADTVMILPVYTAGESPIDGTNHQALADRARALGHENIVTLDSEDDIAPVIADIGRPGDLVVGLGAGTITEWINALPKWLGAIPVRGAGGMAS